MKPGLDFLSDLSDGNVSWMLEHGRERQVIANTAILTEGEPVDAMVFVLQGLVGVYLSSLPDQLVATLGPGELMGEIAFLESSTASASVLAVENSLLLEVAFEELRAEIDRNPNFGASIYHALASTASRRLRERERRYGKDLSTAGEGQIDQTEAWSRLSPMLEEFKQLMQRADKAAIGQQGVLPEKFEREIRSGFGQFVVDLNEIIGDASDLHESLRERLGARVQREVLPYLLLTRTSERLYGKPRGYAGDFLSIDWIYENRGAGTGRLGPVLDRCFLDEPAARAVRNRRGLLKDQIQAHLNARPDRVVRVTTMACGPAREVFDVFDSLDEASRLEVTLIDIDKEAIAQVQETVREGGLEKQVRVFEANLVYLALGRQKIDLANQDLIYSIGLIDYFNDKMVGKLMNFAHACLRSGGELILGNFHPRNHDKALMDYVLDWRLIHRTEADMDRLFEGSDFGRKATDIQFEEAGVNLFAACRRI